MSITKEQWKDIAEELANLHTSAKFKLIANDGNEYEISVERRRVSEDKLHLAVFIDGSFSWGWGWPTEDSFRPLVKSLWREKSRAFYKTAEVKKIEKLWGKRKAKLNFPKLHERQIWWEPIFPTSKGLVSKLKKINNLELVQLGFSAPKEVT